MKKFLRRFLPLLALACAALAPIPAQAQFGNLLRNIAPALNLPGVGQPQQRQAPAIQIPNLGGTPVAEEIEIGRQLAGNLLGAAPLVKDDALQSYVNRVGRWIAAQGERTDINWYFGVLESDDLNAFALPGGYVFVTRGLYARLESEAELAGVLAHEIGHVLQKHHLKILEQSKVVSTAGSLLAARGRNAIVQNLIGNGAEAVARSLDKDAEYEADRIGVVLATRAGYDPYGLPSVLTKLAQVGAADSHVALLFKTHPLPQDRLMHLGDAMQDHFDKYGAGGTASAPFALAPD